MLTHPPAPEDVAEWKRTAARYRDLLRPNRISGRALYDYLQARYPLTPLRDARADRVVCDNILKNKCFAEELPEGVPPEPACAIVERRGAGLALYRAQEEAFSGCEIFVGIDLAGGYFLVEGSSLLWDELYARRGLNETDLKNDYCVSEYIACLARFGLLEQTLGAGK